MRALSPTHCRAGFTLLELLAVIAIIVVLAALLFPVGVSMLQRAHQVRCTSNLQQIGVALQTYIAENNGYYPPNRNNPAPLNRFLHETLRRAGVDTYRNEGETYRDAGIWFCPSDKGRPAVHAAKSYGVNFYLGAQIEDPETPAWQKKPLASNRTSKLIYLIDHDSGQNPKATAGNLQTGSWPLRKATSPDNPAATGVRIEFRHAGGLANALFVDGHVEPMTYDMLANTNEEYMKGD